MCVEQLLILGFFLNIFAGEFFASNVQVSGTVPNALNIKNYHQGVYDVAVSCTTAGKFQIHIKKIDRISNKVEDIIDSPFPFLVVPAAAAAQTMIINRLSITVLPVVGTPFTLSIQAYDRFGNKIVEQSSGVITGQMSRTVDSAKTISVAGSTFYRGNGTNDVVFVATLAGQYSVSLQYQSVDIGASRSLRSPFQAKQI
jgi:hypothetical protein